MRDRGIGKVMKVKLVCYGNHCDECIECNAKLIEYPRGFFQRLALELNVRLNNKRWMENLRRNARIAAHNQKLENEGNASLIG